MIRSLHPEEAQQSSAIAITRAKEQNEARDDGEFEALASEFKSLLSKISTHYGEQPDQTVALGFALAQSTQQVKQTVEARVNSEQSEERFREESRDSEDSFDVMSDQGSVNDQSHDQVSERESKSAKKTEQTERVTATREAVNQEASELLGQEVSAEGVDVNVEASSGEDVSVAVENHVTSERLLDSEGAADIAVKVRAVLDKMESQDGEEEVEEDVLLGEGFEELADEENRLQNNLKTPKIRASNDSHTTKNEHSTHSTKNSTEQEGAHHDTPSAIGEVNPEGDMERVVHSDGAGSKKAVRIGDEALRKQFAEVSPTSQVLPERERPVAKASSTTSITTALLRQAFEQVQAMANMAPKMQKSADSSASVMQSPMASSYTPTEKGEETSKTSRPNQRSNMARMLQRVSETLKEAARSRDGKSITLKLDPVDLGKVRVDVSLREGRLHAKITPDNQEVMQSLRENAHDLQASLRKLGLTVDSVSVSIGFERFEEEGNSQNLHSGSTFQDEGHNLPFEEGQVPENMFGNDIASNTAAGSSEASSTPELDHWIA
jgi:flagellar hook-length control protein FliK